MKIKSDHPVANSCLTIERGGKYENRGWESRLECQRRALCSLGYRYASRISKLYYYFIESLGQSEVIVRRVNSWALCVM